MIESPPVPEETITTTKHTDVVDDTSITNDEKSGIEKSISEFSVTIRDLLRPSTVSPENDGPSDSNSTLTDKASAAALPVLEKLASKHQQAQVLAEKAALLLGLARQFETSSRGKALQADAESFIRLAGEVKESEDGSDVIQRAQEFADAVMQKYDAYGKGVFEESQKLWDELMGSSEAGEMITAGESVLKEWLNYGDSEEGKKLVDTLQSTIFSSISNSSEGLLELAQSYSADADAWLDAMEKNKSTILKGVENAQKAVNDDPELVELLRKGKKLILKKDDDLTEEELAAKRERMKERRLAKIAEKQAAREARRTRREEKKHQPSPSNSNSSSSNSIPPSSTPRGVGGDADADEDDQVDSSFFDSNTEDDERLRDSDFDSDKSDGQTEEALSHASSTAQQAISDFQSSALGKKALQKGADVLKSLHQAGDLSPESVIENLKKLQDNPRARQDMATKIKDAALEFLLSYLPDIKIAPLHEDGPKSSYSLENIDLSGFKVRSQDVDVILTDHGVIVAARRVSCTMNNLKWTYKSKKFPYVGSHGDANAASFDISVRIILEVERSLRGSTDGSAPSHVPAVKSFVEQTVYIPKSAQSLAPDAPSVSQGSDTDSNCAKAASAPAPVSAPAPASAPVSAPAPTTSTSTSTSTTNNSTKPAVSTDINVDLIPMEASSSNLIINKIEDVFKYDYALVLVRERFRQIVEMPNLEVEITNCWLSSIMNVVLTILQENVRNYVEKELNQAILKHSGHLLTTINEYAREYLPLFASVKDKVVEKAPKLVNIASDTINEIQQNVRHEISNSKTDSQPQSK